MLLTALAEKQWVEEDVLARDLNLPPKMVRKAMRYFEQVRWLATTTAADAAAAAKQQQQQLAACHVSRLGVGLPRGTKQQQQQPGLGGSGMPGVLAGWGMPQHDACFRR